MSEESGGEAGGEKPYEPSQKRIEDARKKGDIAVSADLTTAAAYGGMLLAAFAAGGALMDAGAGLAGLLSRADRLAEDMFNGGAAPAAAAMIGIGAGAIWPFIALPAALALLTLIAQRAIVIAPNKIAPDPSRLSPLTGLRNKFGLTGIVEFAKSFVKLILIGGLMALFLWRALPEIIFAAGSETGQILVNLVRLVTDFLILVTLIALVIGIIDLVWQHLRHRQKLMMSRQEMVEEQKEAEGDPQLKGQRRQRAMAIANNRMLADVPQASVVIVNPTHYAVALRWRPGIDGAPVCLAKGTDHVAAAIRKAAAEAGVPIMSDPPTARALFATTKIGDPIPREEYRAVAAAIRFADRVRARGAAQRTGTRGPGG